LPKFAILTKGRKSCVAIDERCCDGRSIIALSGQIEAEWVHRLRFDRATASTRYTAVATSARGPAAMAEAAQVPDVSQSVDGGTLQERTSQTPGQRGQKAQGSEW
jgi:hypothetical protein